MRIKIRDKLFDSVNEAAAAFGVLPGTIIKANEQGTLDRVGLRHRPGSTRKIPVTYNKTSYPSLSAAARANGIPKTNFQRWWHKNKNTTHMSTST